MIEEDSLQERKAAMLPHLDERQRRLFAAAEAKAAGHIIPLAAAHAPALIAAGGERASYRFFEFFTANIRNPHTRRAYARAAVEFFDWLSARGVPEEQRHA